MITPRVVGPALLSLLLAILSVSAPVASSQEVSKDSRYYESLARNAYKEKNYPAFLENMKRAAELRPNHPRLMYNLAAAYALNGDSIEAVAWLRKTAAMGLIFPAGTDSDFVSLQPLPEFKSVLAEFEKNKTPRVKSVTAFTVSEKDLIPESVAYDQKEEVFYLGSVYKRKIVTIDKNGTVKLFADESDNLWSVMGMKVDQQRRLLWVCTTAHKQMSGGSAPPLINR